jgi:hypothetical protein
MNQWLTIVGFKIDTLDNGQMLTELPEMRMVSSLLLAMLEKSRQENDVGFYFWAQTNSQSRIAISDLLDLIEREGTEDELLQTLGTEAGEIRKYINFPNEWHDLGIRTRAELIRTMHSHSVWANAPESEETHVALLLERFSQWVNTFATNFPLISDSEMQFPPWHHKEVEERLDMIEELLLWLERLDIKDTEMAKRFWRQMRPNVGDHLGPIRKALEERRSG